MKLRCVAIDDEPLALKQMAAYIEKTPFLEMVAACRSAFEAMDVLAKKTVDILFVDINMPGLSGMDFVKSLTRQPLIIFTTAYSEYAIEGFKVNAIDYLLKPIAYDSFLKAVNKAQKMATLTQAPPSPAVPDDYIFVKADHKLQRIAFADIEYIESKHEYIKIFLTTGKPIMTLMSMKAMEEALPVARFMRVHRSYIVQLSKIKLVERSRIVFGEAYIPIGDQYRDKLTAYLEGKGV